MEHGRDHDERQQKIANPHRNQLPEDDVDVESKPTTPAGAEVAPTRQAERRERERHRLEREIGRWAAGTAGRIHDDRKPFVDRGSLAGVAREADRRVVGHDVPSAGGNSFEVKRTRR